MGCEGLMWKSWASWLCFEICFVEGERRGMTRGGLRKGERVRRKRPLYVLGMYRKRRIEVHLRSTCIAWRCGKLDATRELRRSNSDMSNPQKAKVALLA